MNFLDFLFPRKCLGCGKNGRYFCSGCLNFLPLENGSLLLSGKQKLDGLTSVFRYRGLIKRAIKKLKYRFVRDLANDLSELFLSFLGEDKIFSDFCLKYRPTLIPIPLHRQRQNWRGFNQSELLGKLIASNLGLKFIPDLLIRVKNTKPQAELEKKSRLFNIKGAFKINPNCKLKIKNSFGIENCKFIVFDDVWTSGATLNEAAKILKKAGTRSAWGLTLAR